MKINVVAFSTNGCRTAMRLREALREDDVRLFSKTSSDNLGLERIEGRTSDWTRRSFEECDALVYIGAIGIAVRYIAPHIRRKDVDPAVVCMDEHGKYTIPILSGHIGGGNKLAKTIAGRMGSEPVITTATDINGKFSVDTFATENHMRIMGLKIAKDVAARVLDGRFVGFCSDTEVEGELPTGLTPAESGEFGVCVTHDASYEPFDTTLRLVPMDIVLGIGCRKGADPVRMQNFVNRVLAEEGISPERVSIISSIDLKRNEVAILELSRKMRTPVRFHTAEDLMSLEGEFTRSEFVHSVTAVDCVCERSAVIEGGGELIRRKTVDSGMTLAIARVPMYSRF